MKTFYTYIITNDRKTTLYVGVTNNIGRRRYNLHRLVLLEVHDNERAAIAREKALKGKTRAKKIALIEEQNPAWSDLSPEESF